MSELEIKTVHGSAIADYLEEIARLRISVFREFPYLYDGSFEYEQKYLEPYIRSDESVAVLALDGESVAGVSTGLPMDDETEEFQRPFTKNGYDISTIFYCGESVLLPAYRGRGVYSNFFSEREGHAKSLGRFSRVCFCAVQRATDHPLRPDYYQPLDPIWEKYGYHKVNELTTTYRWKDIDQDRETDKEMVFWMKEVGQDY